LSEKKDFEKKREKNRAIPYGISLSSFCGLGKLYSISRKSVKKAWEKSGKKREKRRKRRGKAEVSEIFFISTNEGMRV
jgi:hypothetical protein